MSGEDEVRIALHDHYEEAWPGRSHDAHSIGTGPIVQSLPGFEVLRFKPARRGDVWVYVSLGAWKRTLTDGSRNEFYLLSRRQDVLHVETMVMLANFHADPEFGIDCGDVIEIGRPWYPGSTAGYFYVSLPYDLGPDHEYCHTAVGDVRLLWLVPVTEGEARLVREEGGEALEARLEESGADPVNPRRQSVV